MTERAQPTAPAPCDVDAIREWRTRHDPEVRAWADVLGTIGANIDEADRCGTVTASTVRLMHAHILRALGSMRANPARHLLALADDYARVAGPHAQHPQIEAALAAWRKVGLEVKP